MSNFNVKSCICILRVHQQSPLFINPFSFASNEKKEAILTLQFLPKVACSLQEKLSDDEQNNKNVQKSKEKFKQTLINVSSSENKYLQSIKRDIKQSMQAMQMIETQREEINSKLTQRQKKIVQILNNQTNTDQFMTQPSKVANQYQSNKQFSKNKQNKCFSQKLSQSVARKRVNFNKTKICKANSKFSNTQKQRQTHLSKNQNSQKYISAFNEKNKQSKMNSAMKTFSFGNDTLGNSRQANQQENKICMVNKRSKQLNKLGFFNNLTQIRRMQKPKKYKSQIKCQVTSFPPQDRRCYFLNKFSAIKLNMANLFGRETKKQIGLMNKSIKMKTQPMKAIAGWESTDFYDKGSDYQLF